MSRLCCRDPCSSKFSARKSYHEIEMKSVTLKYAMQNQPNTAKFTIFTVLALSLVRLAFHIKPVVGNMCS